MALSILPVQILYAKMPLRNVKSWGYWLQAPDIQKIAACPYDLMVIDYSFDGTDSKAFTSNHLETLHRSNKHVLSYFSIGEAESYRFYWKKKWKPGNPSFLGPENSDWPGNYKVKYWDERWWSLALKPYLNRILSAGFDGIYLDIIDAYYYWSQNGYSTQECANKMINLVVNIRSYVKKKGKRTFTICPQNALGIIVDASLMDIKKYLKAIDAIGVESLFFNFWSPEDQTFRLECIEKFHKAKKRIFNVEYLKKDHWKSYKKQLQNQSIPIIGYAAHEKRALKELVIPDFINLQGKK
ncbi:cysteinyl-tRNA synthetase [Candidatus Magnetomorum sp. HK-1]|nr:cysteinyl-tRNA synthetase [Candidatus Magnetomorum sp. HK-1]